MTDASIINYHLEKIADINDRMEYANMRISRLKKELEEIQKQVAGYHEQIARHERLARHIETIAN